MWPFRNVLLVFVINLSFLKAEVADVEKRSSDRYRRQSADDQPNWTYDGAENGQDFWDEIGYEECGGKLQSPIYLNDSKGSNKVQQHAKYDNLVYHDYRAYGMKLTNTGRTLKLTMPDDYNAFNDYYGNKYPYITGGSLGPGKYNFTQLIFHFGLSNDEGSEHRYQIYDRKPPTFVLEMQMIHQDEYGHFVIITQLYEIGSANYGGFDPILEEIDKVKYQGESTIIYADLNDIFYDNFEILLFNKYYYRYNGSLTYPPCTEDVVWIIYGIYGYLPTISNAQMEKFRTLMSTKRGSTDPQPLAGNFRRLKKVNGRKIFSRFGTCDDCY